MRAKWMGYHTRFPKAATATVLRSGTDETVMDSPGGGTVIEYVCPGMYHRQVQLEDGNVYDLLSADGGSYGPAGSPMLPTSGQFIAIPRTCDCEKIEVVSCESQLLYGGFCLPPHPQVAKETEPQLYIQDDSIYASDAFYPGMWYQDIGERVVSDAQVRHIIIYNARYNPVAGQVRAIISLSLRLVYNESVTRKPAMRRVRPNICSGMVLDIARVLNYDNRRGGYL